MHHHSKGLDDTLTRDRIQSFFPSGKVPTSLVALADEDMFAKDKMNRTESSSTGVHWNTSTKGDIATLDRVLNAIITENSAMSKRLNTMVNILGPLPKKHSEIMIARIDELERESLSKIIEFIESQKKMNDDALAKIETFKSELDSVRILTLIIVGIVMMLAHKILVRDST